MTDPAASAAMGDRAPLLSSSTTAPPSYAVDAKPLAGYYQSTGTTASWRMEDAVPPGPISEAGSGSTATDNTSTLHATTVCQTFIHLAKGYIGVGMLSLPWALSQLGLVFGVVAVFVMSFWSSYNCWTVVRVKRFIEGQRVGSNGNGDSSFSLDNEAAVSETGSAATTNTNITYPDVGEWAYGKTFQKYVSACIVTQQMAICTVFVSFLGENVSAVLAELPIDLGPWQSHAGCLTLALPFFMSLSFIPSLKGLAPVMAAATIMLLVGLALLGVVMEETWEDRPTTLPTLAVPQMPLALCAILYSYEGICLILPIESAMAEPKHFKAVFIGSMGLVSCILAGFSALCILAFGSVTNGSVTAFLIQEYTDNARLRWWLLLTNLAVSLSVLLTYPLQLFPAVELLGPTWSKKFGSPVVIMDAQGEEDEEEIEKDLTGFDPLPALPEHDTYAEDDWSGEHRYGEEDEDDDDVDGKPVSTLTVDNLLKKGENSIGGEADDAVSLRSFMSSAISFPNQMMPKMVLAGDSPQLRASLVICTYLVAVAVPNVQALISLAGALAGSSSALLIPPILELAFVQHMEGNGPLQTPSALPLTSPPSSPYLRPNRPGITPSVKKPRKWFWTRLKCYILLVLGFIFLLIGTSASLASIVAIYAGGGGD